MEDEIKGKSANNSNVISSGNESVSITNNNSTINAEKKVVEKISDEANSVFLEKIKLFEDSFLNLSKHILVAFF